jgi:hypothetical protein
MANEPGNAWTPLAFAEYAKSLENLYPLKRKIIEKQEMKQLGMGGILAWIGLVWIPVVFSTLFFAIPLLRSVAVRGRNRKRRERNVRKTVLAQVLTASLAPKGPNWISLTGIQERARTLRLPSEGWKARSRASQPEKNLLGEMGWDRDFQTQLQKFTAEFDGEVEQTQEGEYRYLFPEIRLQFQGAEEVRQGLKLEEQELGDIVYASDETESEANEREGEAFHREMERQMDLERYLQAPERLGYMDEFELVAFDEELSRGTPIRA